MDEHTVDLTNMLVRVQKLETVNRRLKRIVLGALVLVGAAVLMGQVRPNHVIEAEKFILKDASGNIRARLEMGAENPELLLLNTKGFPVAALTGGEAPLFMLCSQGCEHQAQLSASKNVFGMTLFGKETGTAGHGLLAAFGVYKGVPGVTLYSEQGKEQVGLDLDASGPKLILHDQSGTPRTTVATGNIILSNHEGKPLWSPP